MANPVCGINAIFEKVQNIKDILRKYSIATQALGTWGPIQGITTSVNVSLTEYFADITNSEGYKTLYDSVTKVYNTIEEYGGYVQQGIDAIKQTEAAIQEVINDFGSVVNNLSGIMQDIQDLTLFDIQILELDLAKIGLNPGDIVTRIKNGEKINDVIGDYKDQLSESSKALLEKIANPVSIKFDDTCAKLPNYAIITIGNVKTIKSIPNPPTHHAPREADYVEQPAPETKSVADVVAGPSPALPSAVKEAPIVQVLSVAKDPVYNFNYLAKGAVSSSGYNIDKQFSLVSGTLKQKYNLTEGVILTYIEQNLNAIGYYLIKPLLTKYPKIQITSGWRPITKVATVQNPNPNAVSKHASGEAFDFYIPDEYWKSDTDNPMQFLLSIIKNTKVGPPEARIGKFKLAVESWLRSDPPRMKVFHVEATYVPFGTNTYNGDTLIIQQWKRTGTRPNK